MASSKLNKKALDEIFPQYVLDDFVDFIARNLEPDDVFSKDQLAWWARNNGFTDKKADNE